MTTAELIELLKTYPADLRVVVNGYEQGYDDLDADCLAVIPIALDTGKHDWEGQHGDLEDAHPCGAKSKRWEAGHDDPGDAPPSIADPTRKVQALVLRRSSN